MNKKLYRSKVDCKVGGVCGGLGEYFGVDPMIFRAIMAVSLLVFGTGLMAYIIAWIIIPEAPY